MGRTPGFADGLKIPRPDYSGTFSAKFGGLSQNTTYYFAAYTDDTVAANVLSFTTLIANNAPTDVQLSGNTVNQSAGANAAVGTLSSTDADAGDSHTYTFVADDGIDNDLFTIDGSTLRINDPAASPGGNYTVRIKTDDGREGTFTTNLTVVIADDIAPAKPSAPDLAATDDTGDDDDNLTFQTTVSLSGTAEPDSTLRIYLDGALVDGITTVNSQGDWIESVSLSGDKAYQITVKAFDGAANESPESDPLVVTLDTTAPTYTGNLTATNEFGQPTALTLTASESGTTFTGLDIPPGLTLDSKTGAITGTATVAGVTSLIFGLEDAAGVGGGGTVTLTITPKPITITSGLNTTGRTYDGTTLGAEGFGVYFPEFSGLVPGFTDVTVDSTVGGTGTFDNPDVGDDKPMTITGLVLTGTDADKYTLTPPVTTGSVYAKGLSITGYTVQDKVYDGTDTAVVDLTNASLVGLVDGDTVELDTTGMTARFVGQRKGVARASHEVGKLDSDPPGNQGLGAADVGKAKTVILFGVVLTGADATNYYYSDGATSNAVADITPAPLTVTGITAEDKVYDGTTAAAIDTSGATLNGVLSNLDNSNQNSGNTAIQALTQPTPTPDDVSLDTKDAIGTFADAFVGTDKTVTITGLEINGLDAGNYKLTTTTTTATVTSAADPQTITFGSLADKRSNDPSFALVATASSGLPVSFTVVSGPALISGSTITLTGATGSVVIRADQAGNAAFDPAPPITQAFTVTQAGPLVYFGTTSDGTEFAVEIPEGKTTGTLFGRIAATGQFYILTFQVNANGTITALSQQILGESNATAAAFAVTPLREQVGKGSSRPKIPQHDVAYTFTGTISGGVLNFAIAELGVSLVGNLEPSTGPTAHLAGLYESNSLNSANGTTTSIVGTTGKVYVLAITPGLVTGNTGTIATSGAFSITTAENATITGNVDAPSTTVSGTLILPDGQEDAFAGLSTGTLRTDRLINLSTRARVDTADGGTLITGFVIGGTEPKRVLLRAIGPGLADLGLTTAVPNPRITIFNATGEEISANDDWAGNAAAGAAMALTGAFALNDESLDAAVVTELAPGSYTMHVNNTGDAGVALAEIYDASENPNSEYRRLVNISSRGNVTGGEGVLVGGFVVTGNSPKRVLIRGIGPGLAIHGVSGVLADPVLKVYNANEQVIATNDDWETPAAVFTGQRTATGAEIAGTGDTVGAFTLESGTPDAALIVTLKPGLYSVELSAAASADADSTAGNALIEIYEIPGN